MPNNSIAFATSQEFSSLLDDDLLIVKALGTLGISVSPAVWDDRSINWSQYDLVVVRSPWDYFLKGDSYVAWIKQFINARSKLLNPPQAILGNIDKRYLLDFGQQGIAIIPSALVEQGSTENLHAILHENNWDKVVIKPTLSAGAYGTWRSNAKTADKDQEKFSQQTARETLLIQPFMPEIQSEGEWSIIYIGGQYSHSVLKKAKGGDFRIQEEHGGSTHSVEPTPDILKQTQAIMDRQKEKLLYARVDGVIRDGQFLLMELEINEPSLFFEHSEKAVEMFVQALVAEV